MKNLLIFAAFAVFALAADVLVISSSMGRATQDAKLNAMKQIAQENGMSLEYLFDTDINSTQKPQILKGFKAVVFDSLAGDMMLKTLLASFEPEIESADKAAMIIPMFSRGSSPFQRNITQEDLAKIYAYWHNGGRANLTNLVLFLKAKIQGADAPQDLAAPLVLPEEGIYHPRSKDLVFKTLKEYQDFIKPAAGAKYIGISFHRTSLVSISTAHIDYLIDYFEKRGFIPIAYFTKVAGGDFIGKSFITQDGRTIVDAIVTFQIMIIDHEPLKEEYKKLNVPVLHAFYTNETRAAWEQDTQGVTFTMIPMYYIIPETIGYTDAMMAASQENHQTKPIEYQINSIANKAMNLSKLRHMPNAEKKLAVMFYNYPAGIKNMSASNLNLPKSFVKLFNDLKDANYSVESKPIEFFTEEVTKTISGLYDVNFYPNAKKMLAEGSAGLYPYDEYIKEFYKLPVKTRTEMIRVWGYPLESKMLYYKDKKWYFLVPRISVGNVTLMPQPRRGEREDSIRQKNLDISRDDAKLWHNPSVPISHAYLASYLYVRNVLKADALIHFGTHGTQEWSGGKERAGSMYDDIFAVLGDMVVVYPYITNNLAEGIQAKRRGRATLISHQTPPFGLAGTYGELSEIMSLMNEYESVDDGLVKSQLKEKITEKVFKLNIHKDMNLDEQSVNEHFSAFVAKAQDYILALGKQAQPLGMHTYGTYPKREFLITTLIQMLGGDFVEKVEGDKNFFAKNFEEFNVSKTYKLISDYVIDGKDPKDLDKNLKIYIDTAKTYYKGFRDTKETKNLLRALNGEYIETGVGGDPIRDPNSMPTGNNMYGFDPSKVPTKAAWETGKKLMEDLLAKEYEKNKRYPQKLAFNLWSLETMRHHGVLESQILYAMGVRPVWNETGISNKYIQDVAHSFLKSYLPDGVSRWISSFITLSRIEFVLDLLPEKWTATAKKMIRHSKATAKGQIEGVEIIPYSELKRPRIDVVISATGLYRDTFPGAMKLIADGVEQVSKLKEPNNFLRQNSLALQKKLSAMKDINASEAEYLSTIRIFSNKTGNYGSGVDAIDETSRWEDDKRISQNYVQTLGYYFGNDSSRWSEKRVELDLYSKNLSGTEGVVFSRTSNLYGLLTSDDPFEYFGSMAMAIRNIDGKAPTSYISNLRDPKDAKVQTTAEFMAQELRSRYFHPNWVQKMKDEGLGGTSTILDVMNNFWGWQVVDPNVIRDDQWQEFVEVYVNDKFNLNIKEWFKDINPDAFARFLERIIEANRKGYFKTDAETLKKLIKEYKELQNRFNVQTFNEKFKDFVQDKAVGFGLLAPTRASVKTQELPKVSTPQPPKVTGQKLEKQQPNTLTDESREYIFIALILGLVLFGSIYELRRKYE